MCAASAACNWGRWQDHNCCEILSQTSSGTAASHRRELAVAAVANMSLPVERVSEVAVSGRRVPPRLEPAELGEGNELASVLRQGR